jgi:C_GCAxxG_C_C family probable redox protein
MDIRERVREFYVESNFNCAEGTLKAADEALGFELSPDGLKIIGAFGGGMASGSTCGALAASVAAIGQALIKDKAHEAPMLRDACKGYVELFRNEFGSLDCAELRPKYAVPGEKCMAIVGKNSEMLRDYIRKLQEEEAAQE